VYRRATASLKRCLALGGAKNHLIVMPDADREMAATNIVASMSGCAGQRCMAASVMVGVSKIDHIVERMVDVAKAMVPGKDIGPVISAAAKERISRYIDEAEAKGAKVLVDGRNVKVPGRENGYFLGPTIIDYVTPDMRIAQEEIFGPVLSVIPFTDIDDAIRIANDTMYGLAAAIWTRDLSTAHRMARGIRAGTVWVNGYGGSDPSVSFGGYKQSGFGRELGVHSIELYTSTKSVWVSL
jgi:malonate-semialdehyde dehydrogenase (acetylating) / methylmalonate-semialdehyde dehydrogenase